MTDKQIEPVKNKLPEQLSAEQKLYLQRRTPSIFVNERPGKGGLTFKYVEVGYVTKMLDAVFGPLAWDWVDRIVEPLSFPNTKQIVVAGELTIRIFDENGNVKYQATRSGQGGQPIKFLKDSNEMVDIGDEYKGASADALKKAASKFGIAADIYNPRVFAAVERIRSTKAVETPPSEADFSNIKPEELPGGEAEPF